MIDKLWSVSASATDEKTHTGSRNQHQAGSRTPNLLSALLACHYPCCTCCSTRVAGYKLGADFRVNEASFLKDPDSSCSSRTDAEAPPFRRRRRPAPTIGSGLSKEPVSCGRERDTHRLLGEKSINANVAGDASLRLQDTTNSVLHPCSLIGRACEWVPHRFLHP